MSKRRYRFGATYNRRLNAWLQNPRRQKRIYFYQDGETAYVVIRGHRMAVVVK